MYAGIGGLAPVLAEIGQHRALTGAEQDLAAAIAARLCSVVPTRTEPSLYDGLGGDVMALRMLAPGREQAALARLAELMTPLGWNTALRGRAGFRDASDGPDPGQRGSGPGRGLGRR